MSLASLTWTVSGAMAGGTERRGGAGGEREEREMNEEQQEKEDEEGKEGREKEEKEEGRGSTHFHFITSLSINMQNT